ncbi:6443_t:CDS:1, partial [Cetraspora pellucida]
CELCNNVLELISYVTIKNNNTMLKQDDILIISNSSNNEKLEIGSMIDLLNMNFGRSGDLGISHTVIKRNDNMDFNSIVIVENELRLSNML